MYKEPLAVQQARSKALKAVGRERVKYLDNKSHCDDIYCNLCYNYKTEKAPYNK